MTEARRKRDDLLERLVALWGRGGHAALDLSGAKCSRTVAEAEIIRLLRPLCSQVAQEPSQPKPAPKPKQPKKDGADNARTPDPEADPA